MAAIVYLLGTVLTLLCAALLLRFYVRVRTRLLLWSGLCFAGLTLSNALLFLDLVVYVDVDLYMWRLATAAVSMLLLVYGLIFESE
jgi:Family of unknown function (DUF5985)